MHAVGLWLCTYPIEIELEESELMIEHYNMSVKTNVSNS